jgi:hypothetical protein
LENEIQNCSADINADKLIQEAIELEIRAGQLMEIGGATDGEAGKKAIECLFLATTIQKKVLQMEAKW